MGKDTAYDPHLYDLIASLEKRILALERKEIVPVGGVIGWAGSEDDIPPGFLLVDGSSIPKQRIGDTQGYPELYGAVGREYGDGDTAGEFLLPPSPDLVWTDIGSDSGIFFESSWGNYSGWQPAGFVKDGEGWVHLRGLIGAGSVGTIFTLPIEYRPAEANLFAIHTGEPHAIGRVDVHPGGIVAFTSGNTSYATLSGIRWHTEATEKKIIAAL